MRSAARQPRQGRQAGVGACCLDCLAEWRTSWRARVAHGWAASGGAAVAVPRGGARRAGGAARLGVEAAGPRAATRLFCVHNVFCLA